MRWIVEGANPQTGRELIREVEAPTAREAEGYANARGMLVSRVRQSIPLAETMPAECLEYRALGLNSRKTAKTIAAVGLVFAPLGIGIPMAAWGLTANKMLREHESKSATQSVQRQTHPTPKWLEFMLFVVIFGALFLIAAFIQGLSK
jgi:hypothetical protein